MREDTAKRVYDAASAIGFYAALTELMQAHPDFTGCYLAGGGTEGALAALRAAGLCRRRSATKSRRNPARA